MPRLRLTSCDAEIAYEVLGEGHPVLLLHGLMLDRNIMKGCMEPAFLTANGAWQRFYIDLPGMGDSPSPPRGAVKSSDDMLAILSELTEQLIPGPTKCALVAYSYGAYLAQGLLYKWPDKFDGALLICPVCIADKSQRTLPLLDPSIVVRSAEYDKIVASCSPLELEIFESFTVQTAEVWDRFQREAMGGLLRANKRLILELEAAYRLTCESEMRLPWPTPFAGKSVVICGKQDNVVGYMDALPLMQNLSRSSLHLIDQAGHNAQIEQSPLFELLALAWLGSVT